MTANLPMMGCSGLRWTGSWEMKGCLVMIDYSDLMDLLTTATILTMDCWG